MSSIERILSRRKDEEPLVPVPVALPFAKSSRVALTSTCFTIDGLLTEEECEECIRLTERKGFEAASINSGNGRQVNDTSVRRSGRLMIDSPSFVDQLWERIRPFVCEGDSSNKPHEGWEAVGLNERLRFLKYERGDYFKPHQDGTFQRQSEEGEECSFMTLMIYLNNTTRGGETNFLNPWDRGRVTSVTPRTGLALVFNHDLLHEGAELREGCKYAIRTDILYRRRRPAH